MNARLDTGDLLCSPSKKSGACSSFSDGLATESMILELTKTALATT